MYFGKDSFLKADGIGEVKEIDRTQEIPWGIIICYSQKLTFSYGEFVQYIYRLGHANNIILNFQHSKRIIITDRKKWQAWSKHSYSEISQNPENITMWF